jgi:hypothetical protein
MDETLSLQDEIKEAVRIARQLRYTRSVQNKIKRATSTYQISRILRDARLAD